MSKGIIGKKIGMTSVFASNGEYCSVTVVEVVPCAITQVKNTEIDGYSAIQLGLVNKKKSKINKPMAGHFQKSGNESYSLIKEFNFEDSKKYSCGQKIKADIFKIGECVNVSGISKGRGFAGVMKRHGFSGGRKTHGSHSVRIAGSIGSSAWPSRVAKGKKLPGHYGFAKFTVKNLEVIDIRIDKNIMLIKGSVPGSKLGYLTIHKNNFIK